MKTEKTSKKLNDVYLDSYDGINVIIPFIEEHRKFTEAASCNAKTQEVGQKAAIHQKTSVNYELY